MVSMSSVPTDASDGSAGRDALEHLFDDVCAVEMNCGELDWIHVSALERMSGRDANAGVDGCRQLSAHLAVDHAYAGHEVRRRALDAEEFDEVSVRRIW